VLYLVFGSLPVLLGLAGNLLLDDSVTEAVIPALAEAFFSPPMAIIFALTLTAAVTSSVDSGLLAPASTFAKNIITPLTKGRYRLLPLTRVCVAVAALISTGLALSGTRGFELLQSTYALGIPSFVVLTFALYQKRCVPLAGVATLAAGVLVWLYETVSTVTAAGSSGAVFSPVFPVVLLGISFAVYLVTDRVARWFGQQGLPPDPCSRA
jgi:Na+/proline symporter